MSNTDEDILFTEILQLQAVFRPMAVRRMSTGTGVTSKTKVMWLYSFLVS